MTLHSMLSRRFALLLFVVALAVALAALAGVSIPGFGFSDGPL